MCLNLPVRPVAALRFAVLALAACEPPRDLRCESGDLCPVISTENQIAGVALDGTPALEAEMYAPIDLGFDPSGSLVALDWNNHRILRLDESGNIEGITGRAGELGDGPEGPVIDAKWNHPTDVVWRDDGSMLVAAWHNGRVNEVSAEGELTFLFGIGGRRFDGDGGLASEAAFDLPASVDLDENGMVYIADQGSMRVRAVGLDGVIQTIVGTGEHGYSGDGGPATSATLSANRSSEAAPSSKLAYHEGALYLADTENSRIRTVDVASGLIETIAGRGEVAVTAFREAPAPCSSGCGYSGDGGPAVEAELSSPVDVEVAPDGTIYIADTDNHCVRRIDTDGVIDTVIGVCSEPGNDGDFGSATLAHLFLPFGIALDPDGVLYVADSYNHRIRRLEP